MLTPELVTSHKEVEYGYLVNASVNEPDSFKDQFTKGKTNSINLITQYYLYDFLIIFYVFFCIFLRFLHFFQFVLTLLSDSSSERQKELDHCLVQNIACNQIDCIHLLLESENDIPTKLIGDR